MRGGGDFGRRKNGNNNSRSNSDNRCSNDNAAASLALINEGSADLSILARREPFPSSWGRTLTTAFRPVEVCSCCPLRTAAKSLCVAIRLCHCPSLPYRCEAKWTPVLLLSALRLASRKMSAVPSSIFCFCFCLDRSSNDQLLATFLLLWFTLCFSGSLIRRNQAINIET